MMHLDAQKHVVTHKSVHLSDVIDTLRVDFPMVDHNVVLYALADNAPFTWGDTDVVLVNVDSFMSWFRDFIESDNFLFLVSADGDGRFNGPSHIMLVADTFLNSLEGWLFTNVDYVNLQN